MPVTRNALSRPDFSSSRMAQREMIEIPRPASAAFLAASMLPNSSATLSVMPAASTSRMMNSAVARSLPGRTNGSRARSGGRICAASPMRARRDDDDQFVLEKRLDDQPVVGDGHALADDAEVEPAGEHFLDDPLCVLDPQRDLDLRVLALEAAEDRRQEVDADHEARPESQRAACETFEFVESLLHLFEVVQDARRRLEHDLAGGGQRGAAPDAIEQPDAELLFQRVDLRAHRGLGELEVLRGAGEALELRDSLKRAQLDQRQFGLVGLPRWAMPPM